MEIITAQEARELAGKTANEFLAEIGDIIKEAAKNKNHEVIIRKDPFAWWLYPNEPKFGVIADVIKALRSNGFEVRLYYAEHQFVDLGLWIKWGD